MVRLFNGLKLACKVAVQGALCAVVIGSLPEAGRFSQIRQMARTALTDCTRLATYPLSYPATAWGVYPVFQCEAHYVYS